MDSNSAQPRPFARFRRLFPYLVMLAVLLYAGWWCFVRITHRPPGAEPYESIVRRISPPTTDDTLPELANLVASLPAMPYSGFDVDFANRGDWTPGERPVLADVIRYLELPGTRSALGNLRAFDGKAIAFDPLYNLYKPLRTAIKTLVADARYQVEANGDFNAAVEDLLCALRLAKLLHDQPTMISLLVAIGCERLTSVELGYVVRDPRMPRDVLEALPQRLADAASPATPNWPAVLQFERAVLVAGLDDFYTNPPTGEGWLDIEAFANIKWSPGFGIAGAGLSTSGGLWNVFSPVFHSRRTCESKIDALLAVLADVAELRGLAAFDRLADYEHLADRLTILDGPLSMTLRNLHGSLKRTLQVHMERDALSAIIAIERYRRDHEQLPETLDVLVPDYLDALPLDWYADAPFGYRVDGDAYRLYSVNSNRRDDGRPGDTQRWESEWELDDYDFTAPRPPSDSENYVESDRKNAYWPDDDADDTETTTSDTDPKTP